jgi:hypothetical protein
MGVFAFRPACYKRYNHAYTTVKPTPKSTVTL